jgi:hypothetical protein
LLISRLRELDNTSRRLYHVSRRIHPLLEQVDHTTTNTTLKADI